MAGVRDARAALGRFATRLARLRKQAGSPSLRQLETLTADLENPLSRSTIAAKLNCDSPPDWDFVVSFVTACARHADRIGLCLPADLADLRRWDELHLRLLRAIDTARAAASLAAFAKTGLRGRYEESQAVSDVPLSVVPRQLPLSTPYFVGRETELASLNRLVNDAGGGGRISAVGGTAGVGKTTLVLHWAHRVAQQFPDGQLYADLRGFDPSGFVTDAAAAVRGFLEALGVSPQQVPADLDTQVGLYRSLLAERRMLVVLDNARDAAHVRPLLPGSPGCLTLVTSRSDLAGLVAVDGAHYVALDTLTAADSHELLHGRVGAGRSTEELAAIEDIAYWCARLPIALSIVAARAATNPHLSLVAIAAELRDSRVRLDAFANDDPAVDVRSVFSWSYRELTSEAARLFRLLGLHAGPDISVAAAVSLSAAPTHRLRALFRELVRANLLVEHTTERYGLHDLLRTYAAELTTTMESGSERLAARQRMLDHYLHTAIRADRQLHPGRDPIGAGTPHTGTIPEHLADHDDALRWFTTERAVLLAAIDTAAATGHDACAWQLAWALTTFLYRRGHWHDQAASADIAVAAATRLGDWHAQARTHGLRATVSIQLGQLDDARAHLEQALDHYRRAGDRAGQAHVHHDLANVSSQQGRRADALDHSQRALTLYQAVDHQPGQANALNSLAWDHAQLGNYAQALTAGRRALARYQALDDRAGLAETWDTLGYIFHQVGESERAIECYQTAIALLRDLGNRYDEATALTNLADAYQASGDDGVARAAYDAALAILVELDHPDAEEIRARLSQTGSS